MRWVGIALSLASLLVLGVLLSRSGWRELLQPLTSANPRWVVLAVTLALTVEVAKAARWQLILGIHPAAFPSLLSVVLTGRLLNLVAPLRAGDIWRVAAVARVEQRTAAVSVASVVAEKLLDGAALGAAGASLAWSRGAAVPALVLGFAAIVAVTVGFGLVLRLAGRIELPAVARGVDHLREGRALTGLGILSIAGLGFGLLVNLSVLQALGQEAGLAAALAMLISGYAAGLLPAGPGQLGVFDLAVATPLMGLGVAPASAIASAITLHLVMLTVLVLGGVLAVPLGTFGRRNHSGGNV